MANLHSRRIAGNLAYWDTHQKRLIDAIGPDVIKYDSGDFVFSPVTAADAMAGWTVTLVEAGGGESTITKPDVLGGAILLTTDAFENDGITITQVGESFKVTATAAAVYFGIKLRISDATQSDFMAGLCITSTALLGGISDGIYFRKVDGSTSVAAVIEKNSTESTTTGVYTMVAATDVVLEFYYDIASAAVDFFADGALVATLSGANLCDDEELTPSVEFLTGEAAAKTMQIDWIRAIQIGR